MTSAPSPSRSRKGDAACVAAADLARVAAIEVAGAERVGEHLGHDVEGDRVVTHYFDCTTAGYRGWRWSVTVARAARAKVVTVDECVLLPGPEAILAPAWVPWDERLEPADLGPGDLLPTAADDPRLESAYPPLGLGRARMLSVWGRDEAADRWREGSGGPHTEISRAAPLRCETCGFLVALAGALGHVFGVCANERAPFDGQVVSYDHGCGAHSEVRVGQTVPVVPGPVLDTLSHEPVPAAPAESADEELGHS
ncbi:MAG TPA: DUF3027 domain-containing protein [Jiangellaceae bacterium]